MPAHRARRVTDALIAFVDGWLPYPATIILVAVVLTLGLAVAGLTWPPLPTTSSPAGVVAITPDDPAAPTPVPAQLLGR